MLETDKKRMEAPTRKFKVGLAGKAGDSIEEVYELFLIQEGFLDCTSRGRMATSAAYQHLGLKAPKLTQKELFWVGIANHLNKGCKIKKSHTVFQVLVACIISIVCHFNASADYVPLYQKNGGSLGDWFGNAVARAGDVNNDGTPDFIVSAPNSTVREDLSAGSVFVYSGATGDLLYAVYGDSAYNYFGWSVAGGGDVNGDGKDDFIVGAPGASPGGLEYAGSAYVYSGSTGTLIYKINGDSADDNFGNSVDFIGDIDADGKADFVIGAPLMDTGGVSDVGSVLVYSGATMTLLYRIDGDTAEDYFGNSVKRAGDVNGDGVIDFIVGAYKADRLGLIDCGAIYVYSGATGNLLYQKNGNSDGDELGISVESAGDVNGDGKADFIAGAWQADSGSLSNAGQAIVYSGATGDLLYQKYGTTADDWFGTAVAGVGDVDGDGKSDFIVGAPQSASSDYQAGSAYLYSGGTGDLLFQKDGSGAFNILGWSVAGLGDLNGDGRGEFIIGEPQGGPQIPYVPVGNGIAYVYTLSNPDSLHVTAVLDPGSGDQLIVNWNPSPSVGVTDYYIYYGPHGTYDNIVIAPGSNARQKVIDSLTRNTYYGVKIRAHNSATGQFSDYSNAVFARPTYPVVLVYGFGGSAQSWNDMAGWLANSGFQNVWIPTEIQACGFDNDLSFAENAKRLKLSIDNSIAQKQLETGILISHIDIIAHSMGGLIARRYLFDRGFGGSFVHSLMMLGTPNVGVNAAGTARFAAVLADLVTLKKFQCLGYLATPFAISNVKNFNAHYTSVSATRFSTVAGTYYDCGTAAKETYCKVVAGDCPCDKLVSVFSNYSPFSIFPHRDYQTDHSGLIHSNMIFGDFILPFLYELPLSANLLDKPMPLTNSAVADSTNQLIGIGIDTVSAGSTRTDTVMVDVASELTFSTSWADGRFTVALEDPNGQPIDSSVASSNPDFGFLRTELGTFYSITNPISGHWKIHVIADSVPNSPGFYLYTVNASSPISLKLLPGESVNLDSSSTIPLKAQLLEGSEPITGTAVTCRIQRDTLTTFSDMTLFDDGTHGDSLANDGIYTNSFRFDAPGVYLLAYTAAGVSPSGKNFNRYASSEFALTIPTGIDEKDRHNIPREFLLVQNYPNPFNPTTGINFVLPKSADVKLEIFNILGQRVRTLVDGFVPAGTGSVTWDGKDDNGRVVSSGVYLYQLKTKEFSQTKKMMFIK